MRRLCVLVPIFAAAAGPGLRPAREIQLDLDPSRTHIEFRLSAVLHTVQGSFELERGSIHFDPETGQAGGEIVINAPSGKTGNPDRDRRMRNDVLETARFPEIVFTPDHLIGKVELEGASQTQIHGILHIHGGEHELTLPVDAHAAGGQIEAAIRFTAPYEMWGMKNPSTLFLRVSGKVEIAIHAIARVADGRRDPN